MPVKPQSTSPPHLSLVVPVYNEQEVIATLLQRVGVALAQLGRPFEVLVVDDGSTDSSPELLAKGMEQYPWLRVLRMQQNGGQSAAFDAGFKAARGTIIATIDGDLQNDPEEIVRLLPLLDDCDMVTGWRKDRHDSAFRKLQTRIANRVRNQFLAALIAIVGSFMPAFLLSGFIFDIHSMPWALRLITNVIQARYLVDALQTLFLVGTTRSVITTDVGALCVIAVVSLAMSIRSTK